MKPFTERPRRASRYQQRLEVAQRREQAKREINRLAAEHDAPRGRRLLTYGLLTAGITIVAWRMLHWFVWFDSLRPRSRGGIVGRNGADIIASGFENPPEPAAWIDPVGLALGLTLGLLITWLYARYFQNL